MQALELGGMFTGLARVRQLLRSGSVGEEKGCPPAEDVGIVLLEAAHSGEASQRPAELVAVQHAKVCIPQWQLPVRALAVPKHHTVACMAVEHCTMQRQVLQKNDSYACCLIETLTGTMNARLHSTAQLRCNVPQELMIDVGHLTMHTWEIASKQRLTWAVHGLQAEFLLLHLEHKHVLLVVCCVSAGVPELKIVDVG